MRLSPCKQRGVDGHTAWLAYAPALSNTTLPGAQENTKKIGQDTGNLTVEELQGTWQEGGEGAGLVAGVLARVSVVLEFVHEEVCLRQW